MPMLIKNLSVVRFLNCKCVPYARTFATISPEQSKIADRNVQPASSTSTQNRISRQDLIYCHNTDEWPPTLLENIANSKDVNLFTDFISGEEERQFERDTYQQLRRLRYEDEHWDDAIRRYREIEKSDWSPVALAAVKRTQEAAFPVDSRLISSVHVLDLAPDGYIKPHIDSERYCGGVVAGLSLLTDSVMRLIHKDHKHLVFDLYLKRCSLYILKGVARYEFTHEVLPDAESYFKGARVPRTTRRLSVICRAFPSSTEDAPDDRKSL